MRCFQFSAKKRSFDPSPSRHAFLSRGDAASAATGAAGTLGSVGAASARKVKDTSWSRGDKDVMTESVVIRVYIIYIYIIYVFIFFYLFMYLSI